MSRRFARLLTMLLCAGISAAQAFDLSDPFDTAQNVSTTAAGRMALPGRNACRESAPAVPLSLLDSVRRALCNNPKTHEAWANVEQQAAAVGLGQSAYLPTLTGSASVSHVNERDTYSGMSDLDSSLSTTSNDENLNFNWVLYDFGLRAANLRYARALLNAASASQDDAVQAVFVATSQAFYDAEAAQAALVAATESEQAAQQSFDVADGKAKAGAGAVADQLQAKTSYAQATLKRIQAQEDLHDALGQLAGTMGLKPDTPLVLPHLLDDVAEEPAVGRAVDQLITQAMHQHPKVLAAMAQLEAARDSVAANRAGGRPSLAFAAVEDRSDTPINRVSTKQQIQDSSIGLQLSIPLFEGFSRTYKVREAEAEARGKEAALLEVQQQVAQEVWTRYMAVHKVAEDIRAIHALLDSANQSFSIAQGRYKAGVGGILELLKAQSDLAAAKEQQLLAVAHWHLARLQLGASLGKTSFAELQERVPPASHKAPGESTSIAPPLPLPPRPLPPPATDTYTESQSAASATSASTPMSSGLESNAQSAASVNSATSANVASSHPASNALPENAAAQSAPAAATNALGIANNTTASQAVTAQASVQARSALPSAAATPDQPIEAPASTSAISASKPILQAIGAIAPATPWSVSPNSMPVIAAISPNPASGSFGPQVLTISGRYFLDGSRINLRDKTHALAYLNRSALSRDESHLQVRAELGCSADWTVEIINPNGQSSGEHPFKVISACVVVK